MLAKQSDFSILVKLELIRYPKNEIKLFQLQSSETDVKIAISASKDGFSFIIYDNIYEAGNIFIQYPKYWEKGKHCVFAFIYDSSKKVSTILLNGSSYTYSIKCCLGGMISEKPRGQLLKGNCFNFKGSFYIYSRKITKQEMLELYFMPKNWNKNLSPGIGQKAKSNILKKIYIYAYRKVVFLLTR